MFYGYIFGKDGISAYPACHKKTLGLLLPASFYGRLCRICSYGGSAFDYLFRSDGQNNKLAVTKICLIKKDRIIHLNIHAR